MLSYVCSLVAVCKAGCCDDERFHSLAVDKDRAGALYREAADGGNGQGKY